MRPPAADLLSCSAGTAGDGVDPAVWNYSLSHPVDGRHLFLILVMDGSSCCRRPFADYSHVVLVVPAVRCCTSLPGKGHKDKDKQKVEPEKKIKK